MCDARTTSTSSRAAHPDCSGRVSADLRRHARTTQAFGPDTLTCFGGCAGGCCSGWSGRSVRNEREYWQQHIQAHQSSGSTQTAYCLRHGLHPKTYRSWRDHLRTEGGLVSNATGGGGAGAVEGVEELAYPFSHVGGVDDGNAVGRLATPVQRRIYTEAEKQRFVLAALRSGLPIERYARMSGLTPNALHRWKHKFAIHMGVLPECR